MTSETLVFTEGEGFLRGTTTALDWLYTPARYDRHEHESEVAPPETDRDHPDRHLSCQEAIEPAFQAVAEMAERSGWGDMEVGAALVDLAGNHMLALAANAETEAELDKLNSCRKS